MQILTLEAELAIKIAYSRNCINHYSFSFILQNVGSREYKN